MGLLNAFKQYVRDAMPGGALNPEVTYQGLLDTAALGTAPVPIVGDVLGLLADGKRLRDNPEERTLGNYGLSALGLLPFVPAMGTIKSVAKAPQADALDAAQKNAVKMLGLPPNNTPMDRAKALGFADDAYHATTKNFSAFDPSTSSSAAAFGPGTYVTYDPSKVSGWAKSADGSNVMPLMVRRDGVLPTQLKDADAEKLSKFLGRQVTAENTPPLLSLERRGGTVSEGAKAAGFTGVDHFGPGGHGLNTVFTDPSRIRSRFAAFDPARINENDLLGRVNLPMLGLLGAGGLGGAYLLRPEE
jgi:hypothetical protein